MTAEQLSRRCLQEGPSLPAQARVPEGNLLAQRRFTDGAPLAAGLGRGAAREYCQAGASSTPTPRWSIVRNGVRRKGVAGGHRPGDARTEGRGHGAGHQRHRPRAHAAPCPASSHAAPEQAVGEQAAAVVGDGRSRRSCAHRRSGSHRRVGVLGSAPGLPSTATVAVPPVTDPLARVEYASSGPKASMPKNWASVIAASRCPRAKRVHPVHLLCRYGPATVRAPSPRTRTRTYAPPGSGRPGVRSTSRGRPYWRSVGVPAGAGHGGGVVAAHEGPERDAGGRVCAPRRVTAPADRFAGGRQLGSDASRLPIWLSANTQLSAEASLAPGEPARAHHMRPCGAAALGRPAAAPAPAVAAESAAAHARLS